MDPVEMLARQNCVSILKATEEAKSKAVEKQLIAGDNYLPPLDLISFKCMDCDRLFPSSQALGGHRASHMKLRMKNHEVTWPMSFKMHQCRVCGIRFPTGPALGGHMKKHPGLGARRKTCHEVAVENLGDTSGDLEDSNKKIRKVLEFDLNCLPPEDEEEDETPL